MYNSSPEGMPRVRYPEGSIEYERRMKYITNGRYKTDHEIDTYIKYVKQTSAGEVCYALGLIDDKPDKTSYYLDVLGSAIALSSVSLFVVFLFSSSSSSSKSS